LNVNVGLVSTNVGQNEETFARMSSRSVAIQ